MISLNSKSRMKKIEKMKNTLINNDAMKFPFWIISSMGLFIMVINTFTLLELTEERMGTIPNIFAGFMVIMMSTNYDEVFMQPVKNKLALKMAKSNNGNASIYDTMCILPIKKNETLIIRFKYWCLQTFVIAVGIIGMNIAYLVQSFYQKINGFFVFVGVVFLIFQIVNFILDFTVEASNSKKYNIIKLLIKLVPILCALSTIGCSIMDGFDAYRIIKISSFIPMKFLAGVPLIMMSIIIIPIISLIFFKVVLKSKEMVPWSCE